MELQEIARMVDELWYYHQTDIIYNYMLLPLSIFEVIALYKINQVLKIYISENKQFLK